MYFPPNFTIPYMKIVDVKTCTVQYVAQLLLPNPGIPVQQTRFITSCSNPLYLGNIKTDYQPEIINNVATTERKIIHNLIRYIKNTGTGRISTDKNTVDPRINTNYLWYHTFKGYNSRN